MRELEALVAGLPPLPAYVLERADWLCPELLAGQGRDRLLEWCQGGMPTVKVEDVRIIGDPLAEPHVTRALRVLPPPVLQHVAQHCIVVVLGVGTFGLCTGTLRGIPLIVARTRPEWIARTTFHETAHAWCHTPVDQQGCPTVAGERRFRELALEEGWAGLIAEGDARRATHEDEAEALAAVWLRRLYGDDYPRLFGKKNDEED